MAKNKQKNENGFSVKELIGNLKQLPQNTEIKTANILFKNENEEGGTKVYDYVNDKFLSEYDDSSFDPNVPTNKVVDNYYYGLKDDKEHMEYIRKKEDITSAFPIMVPNDMEINYEHDNLSPQLNDTISEIREKNALVAECAGEAFRRIVASVLEYNTQIHARCANRVMCEIVKEDKSDDVF